MNSCQVFVVPNSERVMSDYGADINTVLCGVLIDPPVRWYTVWPVTKPVITKSGQQFFFARCTPESAAKYLEKRCLT